MALSLAEIIAAKKAEKEKPPEVKLEDDLFLLSSTSINNDASLRTLLHLVNRASAKTLLFQNDNERLRKLAEWLAPYPSQHLPYKDKIPPTMQSYLLWQLGRETKIPPAKIWPVLLSVIVEAQKISLDNSDFL